MKTSQIIKLVVSLVLPMLIGSIAGIFTAGAVPEWYALKPVAAYLNIPYLLWVSFATLLNAAYFLLNRS